jgi:hypothetical protein
MAVFTDGRVDKLTERFPAFVGDFGHEIRKNGSFFGATAPIWALAYLHKTRRFT